MVKLAINGFGRIGRMVFRATQKYDDVQVVAINDLTDTKMLAYLLKHDSVHGLYPGTVEHDDSHLIIDGVSIPVLSQKDPEKLPWKELDVEVVAECTGFFTKSDGAQKHITAGAQKVLLSAPAKSDGFKTLVLGVNEHEYNKDEHHLISNASCTTNNIAPLLKVLDDNFGIENGYFLTIHSYTPSQNLLDGPHKDLRRSRAAAVNLVPTSSGAAICAEEALPQLRGKITGGAVRVPIPCGSYTQLTCNLNKSTDADAVNELFKNVSHHHLKNIIEYSEDPLVSTDILGNTHSVIFDAEQTLVLNGNHIRIMGWYDNEWGYSHRLVELIRYVCK